MKKLYPISLFVFLFFSLSPNSNAAPDTIILDMNNLTSPDMVKEFYESRNYEPAWTKQGKYSLKAYSFIYLLNNAQYYGLNSENYHLKELMTLKDARPSDKNTGRMESLLTDSFFTFANHLESGQLEKETLTLRGIDKEGESINIAFLENALKSHSIKAELESLEPAHPNYQKLKAELERKLENLYKNSFWSEKDGNELKLEIQKLALNMERWRWEDEEFGNRYIFVNLPSFMLEVWEDDKVTMTSKIIVGSARQKTPIMTSQINNYIIHPTCVPEQILAEELIPIIIKDPSYISRNNYEVLDKGKLIDASTITWDSYIEETFPYVLRQPDPDHKTLGHIKFMLDSTSMIHDRESGLLFFRNIRALSSGCIIIEKAEDLAQYLVLGEDGLSPYQLKEMLERQAYKEVKVMQPLNVYVRYFTADGTKMYTDVYGMDQSLLAYFDDIVKWERSNLNLQRTR